MAPSSEPDTLSRLPPDFQSGGITSAAQDVLIARGTAIAAYLYSGVTMVLYYGHGAPITVANASGWVLIRSRDGFAKVTLPTGTLWLTLVDVEGAHGCFSNLTFGLAP